MRKPHRNLRKKRDIDFRMYQRPFSIKVDYPEVPEINEGKVEVEDVICEVFGCKQKLSSRQKLFGKRCIHHQNFEIGSLKNQFLAHF